MIRTLLHYQLNHQIADVPAFSIPQAPTEAITLSQRVAYLLSDNHESLLLSDRILRTLDVDLATALDAGFRQEDPLALLEIHKTLYQIYEVSLCHPLSPVCQHEHSPWLLNIRRQLETAWMNYELPRILHQLPHDYTINHPESLSVWFIDQAHKESETDRAVLNFFKTQATIENFKLFLRSEAPLCFRFFDALALAQLYSSETVKAEITSNMWDECGHGIEQNSHINLFTRMLKALNIESPRFPIWNDWRPYAGYNLYFCFGFNRQHYFKSLGSLAMPELFDSNRNHAITTGLERLYPDAALRCKYFYSHLEDEDEHGSNWLSRIILPISKMQPEAGMEMAIGGAFRMEAMRRYNEFLALRFGL